MPSSPFGLRTSPLTGLAGEFHWGQDYRGALRHPGLLGRRRCGAGRRLAPVGRREPCGNRPRQRAHHHVQPPGGDRRQEGRLGAGGRGHCPGGDHRILHRLPPSFRDDPERLPHQPARLDAASDHAGGPARHHRHDQLRARRRQGLQHSDRLGHPVSGRTATHVVAGGVQEQPAAVAAKPPASRLSPAATEAARRQTVGHANAGTPRRRRPGLPPATPTPAPPDYPATPTPTPATAHRPRAD